MIIAVDFDDTICANTEFPNIGPPVPLAIDFMLKLDEAGAKLILWTMRSGEALDTALDYLSKQQVPLWAANENPEQDSWTNSPKVYAHKYIDDAAVGVPLIEFEGQKVVDWSQVGPVILAEAHNYNPAGVGYGLG